MNLARRATAEGVGTALLLVAVVGSGIMAQRLCGGNVGLALLANAFATGGALVAIILAFGPISGAHLNPAVTLADACKGGIAWRDVPAYIGAQILGGIGGVAIANMMFGLPIIFVSHHARNGTAQMLSESVATFGLLAVIWGCSRSKPNATPYAVAAYIVGAYWFTSSTSFANPAVTIARSLSDTFAGIRPYDVMPFVGAQLVGAAAATALFAWFFAHVDASRRYLARATFKRAEGAYVCRPLMGSPSSYSSASTTQGEARWPKPSYEDLPEMLSRSRPPVPSPPTDPIPAWSP